MKDDAGDTGGWALGRLVPREAVALVGLPAGFTPAKIISHEEQLRLHGAYEDLAIFNLSRLTTPFHIASGEFLGAARGGLETGNYLALDFDATMRVNGAFDMALASLTQAHTQIENAAARFGDKFLNAAKIEFKHLRTANPDYLLLWQLRNLSQHQRAASSFLSVAHIDGQQRLTIAMDQVLDFVNSCQLSPRYQGAWDQLRKARKDMPPIVDVVDTLYSARHGYDLFAATLLTQSAPYVDRAIRHVSTSYVEACDSKLGVAVVRRDVEGSRKQWIIDPRTFEGSMLTMNWANEYVGLEPHYHLPAEGLFPDPPNMIVTQHRAEE
ncbi:hypothetical protein [Demequina aurantiaca]|uniref:hypothetical protein n=1 Tax=Demequina aurantiaca TaxID=676200 RepID=UPI003D3544D3